MLTLNDVLDRLEKYRQRAWYDAVANYLGVNRQSMFIGYPFDHHTCWVVSKTNGLPSNFRPSQIHPDIGKNLHIIQTADELTAWLARNP